jgi:hypothetical protein
MSGIGVLEVMSGDNMSVVPQQPKTSSTQKNVLLRNTTLGWKVGTGDLAPERLQHKIPAQQYTPRFKSTTQLSALLVLSSDSTYNPFRAISISM